MISGSRKLRIDYIQSQTNIAANGLLGITILPGRKDLSRNLLEDIVSIEEEGIRNILCLVSEIEFHEYGVPELKNEYRRNGFEVYYLSVMDQGVCTNEEMTSAIEWLHSKMAGGEKALVHCVGGLGRSGMVAACFHKRKSSLSAAEAIALVRQCRSPHAIETESQEDFIQSF